MAKNYEGVGIGLTLGTTGVTFLLDDVNLPAWAHEMIDVSNLGQSANDFKMMKRAKLRTLEAFDVSVHQDPAIPYNTTFADTELISISFPDSLGTLTFQGTVSGYAQGNNTMDDKPQDTVTITPTNQNSSGVYVAPAFA